MAASFQVNYMKAMKGNKLTFCFHSNIVDTCRWKMEMSCLIEMLRLVCKYIDSLKKLPKNDERFIVLKEVRFYMHFIKVDVLPSGNTVYKLLKFNLKNESNLLSMLSAKVGFIASTELKKLETRAYQNMSVLK